MGNGMHEAFTLTSLRACYGCVDWYPYYRHPANIPPEAAPRPDTTTEAARRAAGRPRALVRRPTLIADRALIRP